MRKLKLPRLLYDYFIKHWFLADVIMSIPTHYLLLTKTIGSNFGLLDDKGQLNSIAFTIFIPLFILSLIFTLLKTYTDKYNEEVKYNGQYILQKILSSGNMIKEKKTHRFIEYIEKNHGQKNLDPFQEITQPKHQIIYILEKIQMSLSDIFGINTDDIGLSIIYKIDTSTQTDWHAWKYLYTMNIEGDLTLKELIENKNTSANQIINSRTKTVFYADKRRGETDGKFVKGLKDEPHKCIGSIVCRDISIDTDNQYISAILSITTYGQQICEEADKESEYRLLNVLLPNFENRLRLELALLYIKEILAQ